MKKYSITTIIIITITIIDMSRQHVARKEVINVKTIAGVVAGFHGSLKVGAQNFADRRPDFITRS